MQYYLKQTCSCEHDKDIRKLYYAEMLGLPKPNPPMLPRKTFVIFILKKLNDVELDFSMGCILVNFSILWI